jgi:hypothetical protein
MGMESTRVPSISKIRARVSGKTGIIEIILNFE